MTGKVSQLHYLGIARVGPSLQPPMPISPTKKPTIIFILALVLAMCHIEPHTHVRTHASFVGGRGYRASRD